MIEIIETEQNDIPIIHEIGTQIGESFQEITNTTIFQIIENP